MGSPDYAILLHGMGRTRGSMGKLSGRLRREGFTPVNIGYPSTRYPIEQLARDFVAPAIAAAVTDRARSVHFVTHSLGGIIARCYLHDQLAEGTLRLRLGPTLGRVVMLAPPNRGSEIADWLRPLGIYRAIMGPPGQQLGTGPESVPSRLNALGPVRYPVGVIAGEGSLNPLFSARLGGPNDGTVAVDRTRLDGMVDFLTVPRTHTFIMHAEDVCTQVVHFLREGEFRR